MGSSFSTKREKISEGFFRSVKDNVSEEIARRAMLQREVQMSVNIARARDNIQIFGTLWVTAASGVLVANLLGKRPPSIAYFPLVGGSIALGNLADMAYGNKLARVTKEAEYIMEHEKYRFVPMKQAPFAKFYTEEEKNAFFEPATPAAMLWPSSMFSRSVSPIVVVVKEEGNTSSS